MPTLIAFRPYLAPNVILMLQIMPALHLQIWMKLQTDWGDRSFHCQQQRFSWTNWRLCDRDPPETLMLSHTKPFIAECGPAGVIHGILMQLYLVTCHVGSGIDQHIYGQVEVATEQHRNVTASWGKHPSSYKHSNRVKFEMSLWPTNFFSNHRLSSSHRPCFQAPVKTGPKSLVGW